MALEVAVALAVFILPGMVIAWSAGMRPHRALVVSIPITAGVWGLLAAIYGAISIPFTQVSVWIGTALMVLVAALWRAVFNRRRTQPNHPEPDVTEEPAGSDAAEQLGVDTAEEPQTQPKKSRWQPDWSLVAQLILPVLGTIFGASLMMRRGLSALRDSVNGVDSIFQGWDVMWHASVVRFIMDERTASATHMGELQNVENHNQLFYPSAWHTLAFMFREVTGITPMAAINIAAMVIPAIGLALTASLIAWIAVRGRSREVSLGTVVAAFLAPIIVAGIVPLYYVGHFVSMWPYVAATALIGPIVWVFRKIPHNPIVILPAALALTGVAMMHPAPVTYAVIIVVFWWLGEELFKRASASHQATSPVGSRVRGLLYMVITAVLAVAMLVPQFLIGSEQTSEVEAFTDQQDVSRWQSWTTVLFLQTRHADEFGIDWWMLWLGVAGMIMLVLWRRRIWLVLTYWLFALIAVDSVVNFAGPVGSIVRAVGALHYNTTHRLVFPVAILTAVFAAAAVGILIHLLFQWLPERIAHRRGHGKKTIAVTSSIGALIALLMGSQLPGVTQTPKSEAYAYLLGTLYKPRVVTDKDLQAFDWLAQQPKAYDGLILNNPDEGAGWMYAYNGLKPLHRHYLWPTVDDEDYTTDLYWNTNMVGQGLPAERNTPAARAERAGQPTAGLEGDRSKERNRVDEGMDALNINYIISSPPHFWDFQDDLKAHGEALYNSPGVTPVYQDDQLYIYAVNAHFSDEELQQILGNSPKPPQSPPIQDEDAIWGPVGRLDPNEKPGDRYFVPEREGL